MPLAEDLGSKNGTLVNGNQIERAELSNGDILQLGNMGPRFAVVCVGASSDTLATVEVPKAGAATEEIKSGRDLSLENTGKVVSADGGKSAKGNVRSKRTVTYQ